MGLNILVCINDTANETLTQQVSSVEIYEKLDKNTSFKLDFMVDVCDEDIAVSLDQLTDPGSIISILTVVDGSTICLVKGPVTQQQIHLEHGGAGSSIHVEGEDTGNLMDLGPKFEIHEDVTDADIVTGIISGYNMAADVEATPASTHNGENHSLVQRVSDLDLVRSLASRNGFHFWITYSDTGSATGHFRPRSLDGEPVAELLVNLQNNNIDNLRIRADARRPSQSQGIQLDLRTREAFEDTVSLEDNRLGREGLSAVTGGNLQSMHLSPTVDDVGALQARSIGALREAQWFIHATCRTSLHRLCKLVRSHTLVQVQGAGSRHSGKYYVKGVKHIIGPVAHVMELELSRNAWGNESGGVNGVINNKF